MRDLDLGSREIMDSQEQRNPQKHIVNVECASLLTEKEYLQHCNFVEMQQETMLWENYPQLRKEFGGKAGGSAFQSSETD